MFSTITHLLLNFVRIKLIDLLNGWQALGEKILAQHDDAVYSVRPLLSEKLQITG